MLVGFEVKEKKLWSLDSLVFSMVKSFKQEKFGQTRVICVLCWFVFLIIEEYSFDSLITCLIQELIKIDFKY